MKWEVKYDNRQYVYELKVKTRKCRWRAVEHLSRAHASLTQTVKTAHEIFMLHPFGLTIIL